MLSCTTLIASKIRSRVRAALSNQPEQGSAVVEFIGLAVLLMIPLIYLVITLSQVQAGSYAATSAADQAAKVYLQGAVDSDRSAAAYQAATTTASDYGITVDRVSLELRCSDGDCATPGSTLTATVTIRVPMPLIPSFLGSQLSVATVDSSTTIAISEYQ